MRLTAPEISWKDFKPKLRDKPPPPPTKWIKKNTSVPLTNESPPKDTFFGKERPRNYGFETQRQDVTAVDNSQPVVDNRTQQLFNTDISQLPVKDIQGKEQPQGLLHNAPDENVSVGGIELPIKQELVDMVKHPLARIDLASEQLLNHEPLKAIGNTAMALVEGVSAPFTLLDYTTRKIPFMGDVMADIMMSPFKLTDQTFTAIQNTMTNALGFKPPDPLVDELFRTGSQFVVGGGLFKKLHDEFKTQNLLDPTVRDEFKQRLQEGLQTGKVVEVLGQDKVKAQNDLDRAKTSEERLSAIDNYEKIDKKQKEYQDKLDNLIEVKDISNQELHNATVQEIQKDQAKAIIRTLDKDKETALQQVEDAPTPEERLKAVDTVDKIEKKQEEYKQKLEPIETKPVKTEPVQKEKPIEKQVTKPIESTVEPKVPVSEQIKQPENISKPEPKIETIKKPVEKVEVSESPKTEVQGEVKKGMSAIIDKLISEEEKLWSNSEGEKRKYHYSNIENLDTIAKELSQGIPLNDIIETSRKQNPILIDKFLNEAGYEQLLDSERLLGNKTLKTKTLSEIQSEIDNLPNDIRQRDLHRLGMASVDKNDASLGILMNIKALKDLELKYGQEVYRYQNLTIPEIKKLFKETQNAITEGEKPKGSEPQHQQVSPRGETTETSNRNRIKQRQNKTENNQPQEPTETQSTETTQLKTEVRKLPNGRFQITEPDGYKSTFVKEADAIKRAGKIDREEVNYQQAKKDLGKPPDKISALPVDYYAKQLKNLTTIGKYHFENGAKKFTDWAKKVIKDTGDWIRPRLKSLWNEVTKNRADENVTEQGLFNFRKKTIEDNIKTPNEPKVNDYEQFKRKGLSNAMRKKILESDIFTKGDKKAGKDKFNYDNFSDISQVNELIEKVSKENKKEFDVQKRDMVSWTKSKENADYLKALGWDERSLLSTVKGDSQLAARIVRSKDIILNAGKDLLESIKNLPEGQDAKIALGDKFIKYNALVKNTKGLISEAGRALNIAKMKGREVNDVKIQLAEELKKLGLEGDVESLGKALEIIEPTFKDKFYYWWYNSMLSNPLTDLANIGGNTSHFSWELFRTAITNKPSTTRLILRDLKDAHKTGVKEVQKIWRGQEKAESKFDYNDKKYIEAFSPTTKAGKRFKSILPTTRLAMEDAYARNLFGALRKRQTLEAISKETGDPYAQVEKTIEAVYKNPELALLDEKFKIYDKHLEALERFIDFGVFQTPLGKGARSFQTGINHIPVLKAINPFMRIAINLTKVGMRNTPYGFKDLLGKRGKELTRLERKDVITRALMGTAFFGGLMGLMGQDLVEITGHGVDDKDKRELWHKQGYSENMFYVKVGGEKYGFSYKNISPMNIPLSILGSYMDDQKYNQISKDADKSFADKMLKSILGAVEVMTTQSFLQGTKQAIDFIKDGDVDALKANFQNLFTPAILSFPRDVINYAKGGEKGRYEIKPGLDALKDKLGITEGLKPKLNQFGEQIKTPLDRYPLPVRKLKADEPLTQFLTDNKIEIAYPSKSAHIGGENMTDEQYYEYLKTSGEKIKEKLNKELPYLNSLKTQTDRDTMVHKFVDAVREEVRNSMGTTTKKPSKYNSKSKNKYK